MRSGTKVGPTWMSDIWTMRTCTPLRYSVRWMQASRTSRRLPSRQERMLWRYEAAASENVLKPYSPKCLVGVNCRTFVFRLLYRIYSSRRSGWTRRVIGKKSATTSCGGRWRYEPVHTDVRRVAPCLAHTRPIPSCSTVAVRSPSLRTGASSRRCICPAKRYFIRGDPTRLELVTSAMRRRCRCRRAVSLEANELHK
jgi:hypothetical protein